MAEIFCRKVLVTPVPNGILLTVGKMCITVFSSFGVFIEICWNTLNMRQRSQSVAVPGLGLNSRLFSRQGKTAWLSIGSELLWAGCIVVPGKSFIEKLMQSVA